jgi:hypothetical protein
VSDKLTAIHDRIYCCRSGSAADTQAVSDYVRRFLAEHAIEKGALPTVQTLAIAFNKKIALEMQERLPPNCTAMTLNSLGYRTWAQALGKNRLDGGDDRLVQAAADLQIANERITRLEASAVRLNGAVNDFLRQAVVSDPDARLRIETSLRELDAALGLRQKPRPEIRSGTLQQARIVSHDQESGMLVLNIGESQGAKIGMTFRLVRGQETYGKAILADVRKGVS